MMGAEVVSAVCRFIDIRWPRVRVFQAERGFDGGRRRKRPAGCRTAYASDHRTPRPWTFFGVAAGLLTRRSLLLPRLPDANAASVTHGSGTTHCLQLRGQCRIFAPPTRFTSFPLSHYILRSSGTVTPICGDIRTKVSMID